MRGVRSRRATRRESSLVQDALQRMHRSGGRQRSRTLRAGRTEVLMSQARRNPENSAWSVWPRSSRVDPVHKGSDARGALRGVRREAEVVKTLKGTRVDRRPMRSVSYTHLTLPTIYSV